MNMPLNTGMKAKPSSDQYQLVQGRQFALDLVESFGPQLYSAKGVADAIQRLTDLKVSKPKSFADGIQHVIDVLVKAQAELPATIVRDAAHA